MSRYDSQQGYGLISPDDGRLRPIMKSLPDIVGLDEIVPGQMWSADRNHPQS